GALVRRALPGCAARLPGERGLRGGRAALALEHTGDGARAPWRHPGIALLARFPRALRAAAGLFRNRARFGWRELHPRPAGLRQADRDRLLGRASAMLAFANVLNFLAHEFAGLRGRRLAFALVLPCAFQCLLFRHDDSPAKMTMESMQRTCRAAQMLVPASILRCAVRALIIASTRTL